MNEVEVAKELEKINISMLKIKGYKENHYDLYECTDRETNQKILYRFHPIYTHKPCMIEKVRGTEISNTNFYPLFVRFIKYFMKKNNYIFFAIDPQLVVLRGFLEQYIVGTVKKWKDEPYWNREKGIYQKHYFLKETEGESKELFFFKENMRNVCSTVRKEEPTSEFSVKGVSFSLKKAYVEMYYEGEETEIEVDFQDNEYKIENLIDRDLETVFRNYLQHVKQKRRLQNLYDPPKKFLRELIEQPFSNPIPKENIHHIYQALLPYYSGNDIEKRAAETLRRSGGISAYQKQQFTYKEGTMKVYWREIFDHILLTFSDKTKFEAYAGTREEIKKIYKEKVHPKIEEKMM